MGLQMIAPISGVITSYSTIFFFDAHLVPEFLIKTVWLFMEYMGENDWERLLGRQACGMQCDELVYNTLMDGCVKANEAWPNAPYFF